MRIEVKEYTRSSAVRESIKDGDLVMFREGPLHDLVIEIGTHGLYCHAAIAFREQKDGEERIFLVQATKERGVHTRLLSEELETFEGGMELWRVKEPFVEKYVAKKCIDEAKTKIGLPYAMTPIYWFALDFITFGLFNLRQRKIDPKAWFCSELVAWAARKGGVDLDPKHPDPATAPSDLVTSGRTNIVGAFAHPKVVARAKK
jgi:hypothetical protein